MFQPWRTPNWNPVDSSTIKKMETEFGWVPSALSKRSKENDLINEKIEKFEEEEKTVETMIEMLDFMDKNEWIENDMIQEVVGMILHSE